MLTENLFDSVLLAPVRQNADTLYIVSGYASATMAHRHLQELTGRFRQRSVRVELIVGMAVREGLSAKDHQGFRELASDSFSCRYVAYNRPVHTKTFAWYSGDRPRAGFTGSANYTQAAFGSARREAMIEHDAEEARDYFDLIRQDTVDCRDPQVGSLIGIHAEPEYSIRQANEDDREEGAEAVNWIAGQLERLPHQRISFLNRYGNLPQRSGLNWGQRPEQGREPNQAYIRLPSSVYGTDYFPPRGEQFTILTDDGRPLVCVRAQDHAKAIHTSLNNSDMGRYFRERLNVPLGAPVTTEDLARYGRTDVDFYKIDEETYYMDFSV